MGKETKGVFGDIENSPGNLTLSTYTNARMCYNLNKVKHTML